MKRSTKYVALDVHQATTVASVREEHGRVIARTVLPTEGPALLECFRSMRGAIHVAFEEGTQAQWLHELLAPRVERVVVCDQRGEPRQGNKGDVVDADQLAERLRRGGLRAVYHGDGQRAALKDLTRTYQNLVEDSTRVMLRLKALFRARGPGLGPDCRKASLERILRARSKREQGVVGVRRERRDPRLVLLEKVCDRAGAGIPDNEPNDLRWMATEETELTEVVVLRHEYEAMVGGVLPNSRVGLASQTNCINMRRVRERGGQARHQFVAEVFVKQQLHAADPDARRRSRAAAKAKAARMCCAVSAGNSSRSWPSGMPPARYSRTS
jgi:hypothetical protein